MNNLFKKILLATAITCGAGPSIFSSTNYDNVVIGIECDFSADFFKKQCSGVSPLNSNDIEALKKNNNLFLEKEYRKKLKYFFCSLTTKKFSSGLSWCACERAPLRKRIKLGIRFVQYVLIGYACDKEPVLSFFAEEGCMDPFVISSALLAFGYKKLTLNLIGLSIQKDTVESLAKSLQKNLGDEAKTSSANDTIEVKNVQKDTVITINRFGNGFEDYAKGVSDNVYKRTHIFTYIDKCKQQVGKANLENESLIPQIFRIKFSETENNTTLNNIALKWNDTKKIITTGSFDKKEKMSDESFPGELKNLVDESNKKLETFGALYFRRYMSDDKKDKLPTKKEFLEKFHNIAQKHKISITFEKDSYKSIDGDFKELVKQTKDSSENVASFILDYEIDQKFPNE